MFAFGRVVPRSDFRIIDADQAGTIAISLCSDSVDAGAVLDFRRRLEVNI